MDPATPTNDNTNCLWGYPVVRSNRLVGRSASRISAPDRNNVRFREFGHAARGTSRSFFRLRIPPASGSSRNLVGAGVRSIAISTSAPFWMNPRTMGITPRSFAISLSIIRIVLVCSIQKMSRIYTGRISAYEMPDQRSVFKCAAIYYVRNSMSHGESPMHPNASVSTPSLQSSPWPALFAASRFINLAPKPLLVLFRDSCDLFISHFTSSFRDLISAFRALKTLAMHGHFTLSNLGHNQISA